MAGIMKIIHANNIDICYETFGDRRARPLVMIQGLVTQMIAWPDDLCQKLADAGHYVIRFDNRDVGLSTKLEHLGVPDIEKLMAATQRPSPPGVPYTLADMAGDTRGVMDALGLASASLCGISMGGMIAQVMAIETPRRVESLICMETTSGEIDLPPATPEATEAMFSSPPILREPYLDYMVEIYRAFSGGSGQYDPHLQRRLSAAAYDRMWYPMGFARQMAAILTAPGRRQALMGLNVPTLVLHGDCDTLLPVEHGRDIAAAVPGATLRIVKGLGHGLAYPSLWDTMVAAIADLTQMGHRR